MKSTRPSVWLLVLNYCSLDDTLGCVDSIRASRYPRCRLLVIDNASPDGSGRELASQLPSHEFLQLPRNVGYAGGNNTGISIALRDGADYILIVNPDIRLPPDAIATYIDVFAKDPRIGALNSIQVGQDGVTIDERFRGAVLGRAGYRARTYDEGAFPEVFEAPALFGAALMLSRAALEKVGAFDPLYFAYGEETDLCRRLRFHGMKLAVTGRSPVVHLRTNYKAGVSPRITFLRLRGFYLSEMKDPFRSFGREFARAIGDLLLAAIGRAPNRYPFSSLHITRSQLARAIQWFLLNGLTALRHKRAEKAGRAHL